MPTPTLTVSTWNVLADAFTLPERYEHVNANDLRATNRFPRITNILSAMVDDNDVVVLQEVEPRLWQLILHDLGERLGTGLFAPHATRPDGVALISRHVSHSRVEEVVEQRGFVMADFECDANNVHVATTHLPHRDQPRRPRIILNAVLEAIPPGPAVLALDANVPWSSEVCDPARDRGWTSDPTEPSGYWGGEWLDTDLVTVREATVRCTCSALMDSPPNSTWPSDHLAVTGVVTLA